MQNYSSLGTQVPSDPACWVQCPAGSMSIKMSEGLLYFFLKKDI